MIFLDTGAAFLVLFGLVAFVGALALAVIVEAFVLSMIHWASVGRCFLDSLVMNGVSAGIGLMLLALASYLPAVDVRIAGVAVPVAVLAIAFVLTVVSEAMVLWLSHRDAGGRAWGASLLVNIVSYVVLVGLAILLSRA